MAVTSSLEPPKTTDQVSVLFIEYIYRFVKIIVSVGRTDISLALSCSWRCE